MTKKSYSPLNSFKSRVDEFEVTKYLRIERDAYTLRKSDERFFLAQWEKDQIRDCTHWLVAEDIPKYWGSSSVLFNAFLLSLWIYSPNKVSIGFKFGVGEGKDYTRLLDHFQFYGVNDKDDYDEADLVKIREIFRKISGINRNGGRLQAGTVSTVFGCFQYNVNCASILYSTALESLLTYSKDQGLTERLAKSYCCLVQKNRHQRDLAYYEFKKVYKVRSDLVHGRHKKRDLPKRNLNNLRLITKALRKVWSAILNDKTSMVELEKNNSARKAFFKQIELGYSIPVALSGNLQSGISE